MWGRLGWSTGMRNQPTRAGTSAAPANAAFPRRMIDLHTWQRRHVTSLRRKGGTPSLHAVCAVRVFLCVSICVIARARVCVESPIAALPTNYYRRADAPMLAASSLMPHIS